MEKPTSTIIALEEEDEDNKIAATSRQLLVVTNDNNEEDLSSGVSMPSSPDTVIDKSNKDDTTSKKTPPLTRVLLEWIFSLRHQLIRSKALAAKLQQENERLKRKTDGEMVQFLSQLQRDAQRVNRTLKAKDTRIAALKADNAKINQENAALRKQLDNLMQVLLVSTPCANCHPVNNANKSKQAQTSISTSSIVPPSSSSTSPPNVSSSTTSSDSATSRFGKGIMSSLKSRLGKLGSSSRKLKVEHRDKFRSVDTVIPVKQPQQLPTTSLATSRCEEEEDTSGISSGTTSSGSSGNESVPKVTEPPLPPQPLQSSPVTNKVSSRPPAPRPRKNRVCISDPPAYNMVTAQVEISQQNISPIYQVSYAAKSCGDIISLSEEAELENSVSPLVMSDSCHHFDSSLNKSSSSNISSSAPSTKGDSLSDERENDSSPEDEEQLLDAPALRRHSSTIYCDVSPSDDIKRCFGTRQTRYSRRKFDFKRRYSSTYFVKSNSPIKTLPQDAGDDAVGHGSSQLVRSRSSPTDAVDLLPKLRSKHQITIPQQQQTVDSSSSKHGNIVPAAVTPAPDSGNESGGSSLPSSSGNNNPVYQTSPRMVGSHSFAGRELLVV